MSLVFLQHRAFAGSNGNIPRIIPTILGVLTTLTIATVTIVLTTRYISSIQIPNDLLHWAQVAREQAYDVCYDGCNDCLDVSVIASACRLTAQAKVEGVICDAKKMWTWADEESKFPSKCLAAVGEAYRQDALRNKRFWWKALYALTLLALPLGYGVFLGGEWVLRKLNAREGNQWGEGPASPRPRLRPQVRTGSGSPKAITNSRSPLLAAVAIMALVLPTQVAAYACTTHPAHNQLFADPSHTLFGVIHGWLSSCHDESYSCGETCRTSAGSQVERCDTHWCSEPRADKTPRDYVNVVVPRVKKCGLKLVDYVPVVVDKRLANPEIEGKLWVKISVNRINATDGQGLDKYVKCLWGVPEPSGW